MIDKFLLFGLISILWIVVVAFKRITSRFSLSIGLLLLAATIPLSLLRKHAEADMVMICAFLFLGVGIVEEFICFIVSGKKE